MVVYKYQKINKSTVKNNYPPYKIDDLFDQLIGDVAFFKMDLESGYHQLRIKDEDIQKTTLMTIFCHYEFVVVPFGITNAPTTFICLTNTVIKPYSNKFVLVFVDDMLVYSKTKEEHD